MGLLRFVLEVAQELGHERRAAKARQRAAERWASTPGPRRMCRNCSEIAYTPGQTRCDKCGAVL